MALFKRKTKPPKEEGIDYSLQLTKRCPECFIDLPLDAKVCSSCHTRIGKVDRDGKARKKTNWVSYIVCIISWAILIAYIQWAFLSK